MRTRELSQGFSFWAGREAARPGFRRMLWHTHIVPDERNAAPALIAHMNGVG